MTVPSFTGNLNTGHICKYKDYNCIFEAVVVMIHVVW